MPMTHCTYDYAVIRVVPRVEREEFVNAGAIGLMSPKERFRWLVAPRSTAVQTSPAHAGRCDDPAALLEHLLDTMVRAPKAAREPA